MPSHGEVGAHEWPVTAGTDRPVASGPRTVDNWTAKLSTETGPRRWGAWLHGDQCPERVGSCSRGAAPESGGDCPDEARKRAVGPTRIARRWGSPSEAARRRGFRLRHQRPRPGRTPVRRAHRIRVRDDSTPTATTWRLSGRQLHFRLRLASPDRGERATPVHDRAGAQDRTQLLPQEEQR